MNFEPNFELVKVEPLVESTENVATKSEVEEYYQVEYLNDIHISIPAKYEVKPEKRDDHDHSEQDDELLDVEYYPKYDRIFPENSTSTDNENDFELASLLECDTFEIIYQHDEDIMDSNKNNSTNPSNESVEEITIIYPDTVEDKKNKSSKAVPNIVWYYCKICSFKTTKGNIFKEHAKEHAGLGNLKMFQCHLCTFKSIYPGNLRKHVLRHNGEQNVSCNLCSYEGNIKADLNDHMKSKHLKKRVKELYCCSHCEYSSKKLSNLKRHTESCQKNISHCNLCDFKTSYKHILVTHLLTHNAPQIAVVNDHILKCDLCNYKTKRLASFKLHGLRCHHQVFDVSFTQYKSNSTKQKFKVINVDQLKVFKCRKCGHSTTDQSNFNRHLKTHLKTDKVTMFQCYTCGLQTKYKYTLIKHNEKHRQKGMMKR